MKTAGINPFKKRMGRTKAALFHASQGKEVKTAKNRNAQVHNHFVLYLLHVMLEKYQMSSPTCDGRDVHPSRPLHK